MRFFVGAITCCNVFNVWPKTSLLPVWHRGAKRLDTPVREKIIWFYLAQKIISKQERTGQE